MNGIFLLYQNRNKYALSTEKRYKKDIEILLNDLYAMYGKEKYKSIIKNVLTSATKYNAKIKNQTKEEFISKFYVRNIFYNENIFTDEEKRLKILKDTVDIVENIDNIKKNYNNIDEKILMFVHINTLIKTALNIYKENTKIHSFIYKIE